MILYLFILEIYIGITGSALTNKLSKVIGILNRLKHIYPQKALLSIYNALFFIPYDIWFTTMG